MTRIVHENDLNAVLGEVLGQAALMSYGHPDPACMREGAKWLRYMAGTLSRTKPIPVYLPLAADAGLAVAKHICIMTYCYDVQPEKAAQSMYAAAEILQRKAHYMRQDKKRKVFTDIEFLNVTRVLGQLMISPTLKRGEVIEIFNSIYHEYSTGDYSGFHTIFPGLGVHDPIDRLLLLLLGYVNQNSRESEGISDISDAVLTAYDAIVDSFSERE